MSWNYRVLQFNSDEEVLHQVHEAYYDEAGHPIGYTPATAMSTEGIAGLDWVLNKMKEALLKPVLSGADFPDKAATSNESPPET